MDDIINTFSKDLFKGKSVLVTGGSSGIGLAIAQGFARLGGDVTALGSSAKKLEAASRDPANAGIRFERVDVRDPKAIKGFVATLGKLDILVNGAGIARPTAEFEDETYTEVMDVNLNSQMRFAMAALPLLKASKGSIINIASMLSYVTDPLVPAYGASKTGVLGLTRHLAHAFGPDGIRVNAISPGYHKTDMTRGLWTDPEPAAKIEQRSALKRWGTVDDLVGTAIFLSSPAAAFVTGTDLPVDGGFVVGGF
ncbi:SDR family NAD(P)-dependent oxidoreductase [Manganibacter manganicus]|uniref:Oxidoreductase n=1 Tax=Manganibacter manganicus TaxID=1873176 RepID=A0A1V8RQF1_9HYPH|nr:SDR family oxidoreductase [Pseudaminobacter manganicus]OQM75395.1 oxidoreductase [Pseudaminobacter manganicus]